MRSAVSTGKQFNECVKPFSSLRGITECGESILPDDELERRDGKPGQQRKAELKKGNLRTNMEKRHLEEKR